MAYVREPERERERIVIRERLHEPEPRSLFIHERLREPEPRSVFIRERVRDPTPQPIVIRDRERCPPPAPITVVSEPRYRVPVHVHDGRPDYEYRLHRGFAELRRRRREIADIVDELRAQKKSMLKKQKVLDAKNREEELRIKQDWEKLHEAERRIRTEHDRVTREREQLERERMDKNLQYSRL